MMIFQKGEFALLVNFDMIQARIAAGERIVSLACPHIPYPVLCEMRDEIRSNTNLCVSASRKHKSMTFQAEPRAVMVG